MKQYYVNNPLNGQKYGAFRFYYTAERFANTLNKVYHGEVAEIEENNNNNNNNDYRDVDLGMLWNKKHARMN